NAATSPSSGSYWLSSSRSKARTRRSCSVLAFDLVLIEEARAIRAEDDGAEFFRADQQQPDPRVRSDRGDEPRVELLELLDRQPVVVSGEPDEAEVAGADDGDGGRVGDRRLLFDIVEVDGAVGVGLARQGRPGDARADALA